MTKKKNKFLLLIFLTAAIGCSMLLIGPSGTLDARLYYTHEQALSWLGSLSATEKSAYIINEYLDFGYLTGYSLLGYLLLGSWALIPGALDLIENVFILLYLHAGNEVPSYLGIVSSLKWSAGFVMVFFAIRALIKAVPPSQN